MFIFRKRENKIDENRVEFYKIRDTSKNYFEKLDELYELILKVDSKSDLMDEIVDYRNQLLHKVIHAR